MKAITVRQPWAHLIAEGVKTIEWRTRPIRYRGPILIHAGAAKLGDDARKAIQLLTYSNRGSTDPPFRAVCPSGHVSSIGLKEEREGRCLDCGSSDLMWCPPDWDDLPLGAVVAVANLDDCLPVGSFYHGDWDRLDPNPPTADVDYINTNVEAIAEGLCESPDASPLAIHHTRVHDIGSEHWSEPIPDQIFYAGGYAVRGNFGYLLSDVRKLARPVPTKGALGLWTPDDELIGAVQP